MSRVRWILIGLLAAAALYFTVFGGEYSLLDARRLERQHAADRERLEQLQAEVHRLRARLDSLENDPAALERIARERYGLIREGERLYLFAEEPDSTREEPEDDDR